MKLLAVALIYSAGVVAGSIRGLTAGFAAGVMLGLGLILLSKEGRAE